jgi:hypothetical protein
MRYIQCSSLRYPLAAFSQISGSKISARTGQSRWHLSRALIG